MIIQMMTTLYTKTKRYILTNKQYKAKYTNTTELVHTTSLVPGYLSGFSSEVEQLTVVVVSNLISIGRWFNSGNPDFALIVQW